MAVSEYDAFGPWVYEIDSEHPAPAFFRPYLENEDYLLRLKIPRNIDRRKATPDMNLYDFVLEAGEEAVRILTRVDFQTETVIPYSELESVRLSHLILNGSCEFTTQGKRIKVPFNAISMKVMEGFLRLVRSRYASPEKRKLPAPPAAEPPDILLANLARDLREAGEDFSGMAFQPERQVPLVRKTLLHRRAKAPAILHMTDGRELLLLERQSPELKAKQEELGYACTFLPLEKLRDVEIRESAAYVDVLECRLKGAQGDTVFLAHKDDRAVLDFYRALKGRR